MISALVDASFLVALGYPRDNYHARAKQFAASRCSASRSHVQFAAGRRNPRIATVWRPIGCPRPPLIPLTVPDFARAMDVMRTYLDADLDLVDCCLTALAERLNITRICTFDRRDFSIIRPHHTGYFELLP